MREQAALQQNQRQDRTGPMPAASLENLTSLLQQPLQQVNHVILEKMQSEIALIPTLAHHLIAAGGKRIRPLLTLASARLCGATDDKRAVDLAACVEFIHSATLLHDDVVDESELRRGQETANEIWGNKASVLVGDFLFSRAFELMVADGSLDVLRILSHASSTIAEGEVLQLTTTNNIETTREDYERVIRGKTACLFAAACEVGAVITDQPPQTQKALSDFGMYLGFVFQIIDDILDYSADQKALGKSIGDDFREGKMTLPIILAAQKANAEEKKFWQRVMNDLDQNEDDFDKALSLLARDDILKACHDIAGDYVAKAEAALGQFPASPYQGALIEALHFAYRRHF